MQISRTDRARTRLRWPSFEIDTRRRLVEVAEMAPVPRPRITVRWQQPVPLGAAATLAGAYKLRPRGSSNAEGGEFEVTDESSELLRRLARDPLVADTQNIDRRTWRIVERPEPGPWARVLEAAPILRSRLAPGVFRPENAVPFVYDLFLALPFAAVAVCAVAVLRRNDAPARTTLIGWLRWW